MKRFLRWLAIGLASLIALAALAEGALQLMFKAKREARMADHEISAHLAQGYGYDPDLYWYWKALPDAGGQVNQYGFRRTKPMEPLAPEGVTRVITLGDSQTFGGGVRAGQAYSDFAEKRLGDGWEVLNAGISGYRSLNVYRLLRLKLVAFEPDFIVVDCMPKDSPKEDGPLIQRSLGTNRLQEWLWKSRLYYFSQLMLRVAGLRPWESLPWPLQLHEIRERLTDPAQGDLRHSPDMGNLELIGRWTAKRGIQAVFMTYPFAKSPKTIGCHAWEGSMPEGYPVFDACATLRESKIPAKELFFDMNHLRPQGNRIVGDALGDFLAALQRGPKGSAP